jgi:hypothetical protein
VVIVRSQASVSSSPAPQEAEEAVVEGFSPARVSKSPRGLTREWKTFRYQSWTTDPSKVVEHEQLGSSRIREGDSHEPIKD